MASLKYIDKTSPCFRDRSKDEPSLDPIDVVMLTLDAENFLDRSLHTVYREIPVRKLLVCDGGSKDDTINILNRFPRLELHVRPDIRTTGKAMEFLFSLVTTKWFVLIDSDIELSSGWYDAMVGNIDDYDVLESGRRILAYHIYREDKVKPAPDSRSLDLCHMIRKSAIQEFQCDDDYMWRYTDILLRQVTEKSGHKYKKIESSYHVHNETERIAYESDKEKSFQKTIWKGPQIIVIDKDRARLSMTKNAKAVVKYLDPEFFMVSNDRGYDPLIKLLDRGWIQQNGSKWLARYDNTSAMAFRFRRVLHDFLKRFR
jgi:glycosyltransferase involved in cell wall biosynthesis